MKRAKRWLSIWTCLVLLTTNVGSTMAENGLMEEPVVVEAETSVSLGETVVSELLSPPRTR